MQLLVFLWGLVAAALKLLFIFLCVWFGYLVVVSILGGAPLWLVALAIFGLLILLAGK